MVHITVHGGAEEVGGNKVLIEEGGSRVLMDFGSRMGFSSQFFTEMLDLRRNTELRDRLTIGALPRLDGIYRADMVRPDGLERLAGLVTPRILGAESEYFRMLDVETFEDMKESTGTAGVEAVFLSHAHMDHTGDLGFVHHGIPLFASETTRTLVEAIDEVTTFRSNALRMEGSEIQFLVKGEAKGAPRIDHKREYVRECRKMGSQESVRIGPFAIRNIDVDHSVPGASSFMVETVREGRPFRILYTGDLRFHGARRTSVDDYVKAVRDPVDVLICEGTRVESKSRLTEDDVRDRIAADIKRTEGLVFVDFSWKDTTRYETILESAKSCGRTFVINGRLAYILNRLGMTPLPENVKVFLKRKGSALYSPADYSRSKHEYGFSAGDDWLDNAQHFKSGVVAADLRADPNKYVIMMSFFDLPQLFDMADEDGKVPNSRFIKAVCEPFSDDMELDEERHIHSLETFGIAFDEGDAQAPQGCANPKCPKLRRRIRRSHVSGHASGPELAEMVEKLSPKIVMPIHSERPDLFLGFADDIRARTGKTIQIILPKNGEEHEL